MPSQSKKYGHEKLKTPKLKGECDRIIQDMKVLLWLFQITDVHVPNFLPKKHIFWFPVFITSY